MVLNLPHLEYLLKKLNYIYNSIRTNSKNRTLNSLCNHQKENQTEEIN